jgi:hypothetical protein
MTQITLESLSAKVTFEQMSEYEWYQYGGRRKTFTSRRNTVDLNKGDLYGLKKLKTGNYYFVHGDTWKHRYSVPATHVPAMLRNSKKKRGVPKEIRDVDMTGRKRAPRLAQQRKKVDYAAPRFKPQGRVKNEQKVGIDFKDYQWRKLSDTKYRIAKTSKVFIDLERGDVFGLRFAKESEGGYIVMEDGRRMRIASPKKYDSLVEASQVLPLNKWPKDTLTAEEVKQLLSQREENIKRKQEQERKDLAEKKRARQAEEKRRRQRERQERAEKQRQEAARLAEKAAGGIKTIQAPVTRLGADDLISEQQPKDDDLIKEIDEMGVDDDDFDLDFDDIAEEDDEFEDEDESNEIEEDEIVDPDMDAKNVEAALDSEIERVRQDARKIQIVDDDEEEDDLDLEGEDELDIDDDEDDEDDESLSLEEQNQQDAEDEALDAADYDDDEVIPDEDEDLEEEDQADLDEDEVDTEEEEDDSDGDEEESEEDTEEEEPEETQTYEEGDVVQFHKDETDQREFLILDVRPLKEESPIMVYEVYDIEADSGEYHTVRVNTKSKGGIEKMAKFVRKLNPKEFAKFFNQKDAYSRTRDPIAS